MRNISSIILLICISLFTQLSAQTSPQMMPQIPLQAQQSPQAMPMQMPQGGLPKEEVKPDPEKFASLFPEIKGESNKLYANFLEQYWYLILILVILSILGIYLIFRNKPQKPIPPIQIAFERLDIVMSNMKSLDAKPFALETSQALRDYIEAVYNLPAPERTTEEFLKITINSPHFDEQTNQILKDVLTLSDMAKFAQHSFHEEDKIKLVEISKKFLELDSQKADKNLKNTKGDSK